jgi:endonuclease/exonuclease/phosphatase family metal-dependent hydrolase
VTTANVHWGGLRPDRRSTFDLAAASAALPGDIRVFQEVWTAPGAPTPISRPPGWHEATLELGHHRRPSRLAMPSDAEVGQLSIVVVSRFPICNHDTIRLPRFTPGGLNQALLVTVETPVGVVTVVAVHLSSALVPVSSAGQVWAIGRRLPPGPTVIAGDHNLWARAAAPLLPGFQLAARGPTWPAIRPRHQIDHIWVRGLTVITGRVLADIGSDHLPVTAVFGA